MELNLTLRGQHVFAIVSCLGDGDTGGGLLHYDGDRLGVVDEVSTTGLHVAHNELIRMLWAPSQVAHGTSIMHYTPAGLKHVTTIDNLTDPHDVLWDGQHYTAVSSYQDCLMWITPEGVVSKRIQFADGTDCWHLNSLLMHNGVLYATAFGRFDQPRAWVGKRLDGTGVLFRVDTGEDLLTGLCCPHTPRFFDGQWVVCSSATSEVLVFSPEGLRVRSVQLQNWVRGLAIADTHVLIGESINRQLTSDIRGGSIAILDRQTWTLVDRITVPFREVYDIVLATPELMTGVMRSARPDQLEQCPPQLPYGPAGGVLA